LLKHPRSPTYVPQETRLRKNLVANIGANLILSITVLKFTCAKIATFVMISMILELIGAMLGAVLLQLAGVSVAIGVMELKSLSRSEDFVQIISWGA
jgi:hypothetical protein